MSSNINWGKLYGQGRCKAVGVSWSDDEMKALHEYKIPVQYVRAGYLTLEVYDAAKVEFEKNGFPLHMLSVEQLREKAEELKIQFTPAASPETLVSLIELTEKVKAKAEKKQNAPKKTPKKK